MAKKKSAPVARTKKATTSFDPEQLRWFVPAMLGVFLIGLIVLFRQFLFSNLMLYGSDTISAGLFYRMFLVDFVHAHGTIPQWDPYIFCGLPFVEAFHGDIFYPLSFLKFFGSIFRMLGYILFMHIFLAGIFMYWTARQFNLSKIASLMAAVCYMYSAWLISLVAPGHDGKIYVTTLYPLTIAFLHRAFEKKGNSFVNFTMLGIVLGVIILAPHPQMSYYTLWSLAFYTVFRLIVLWRETGRFFSIVRPGFLTVYSVVIGLMISAIQFYPGYYYTTHFSPRAEGKSGWEWATSWSLHQEDVLSQLIPEFSGVTTQDGTSYYWGKNAFKDNSESVGPIAIMLALIGALCYRRKESYFFLGLGLFALIYALGATTPIFRIFYWLIPKVKALRAASMIMFLFSFSTSLLAGMGLQYVINGVRERKFDREKVFNYILFGLPGLLLLLAVLFSIAGKGMINAWVAIFYSEAPHKMIQQNVSALQVAYFNLPTIQSGAWLAFLVTGLTTLFVWLYRSGRAGAGVLILAILMPMIHGIRFNARFVGVIDPSRTWGPNPITEYFTALPGYHRVFNFDVLPPNLLPHFDIPVVVGYHGNQPRWYEQLLGGIPKANLHNPRFLNTVSADYIVAPQKYQLQRATMGPLPVTEASNFGNISVYHNPNALPRVYLVDRYRVPDSTSEIYDQILRGTSDLHRLVYLEKEPPLPVIPDTMQMQSDDSAWIADYGVNSVTLGVHCSTNKLLVLTDNYYDAWHATVDGTPTEVLRANGTFRAVAVPAGASRVVYTYYSKRYQIGKWLTLLTSLYALLAVGAGLFWSRRSRPVEDGQEE